jgi:hypothetical protein
MKAVLHVREQTAKRNDTLAAAIDKSADGEHLGCDMTVE